MTAMQWWRSWHGAPMDNKWLVISARSGVKAGIVSAVFWELCDFASQNKERGSIEGFDVEVYSIYSGFSEDEINSVIKALNDKEVIQNNRLVNWVKRQPQREDDSYDRVTKFRELKRNVTQCNAEISSDKDKDKDKDKDTAEEEIIRLYQESIGLITSPIADAIKDALDTYPKEWIPEAIKVAVKREKRFWSYIEGILKGWKREGKSIVSPKENITEPKTEARPDGKGDYIRDKDGRVILFEVKP